MVIPMNGTESKEVETAPDAQGQGGAQPTRANSDRYTKGLFMCEDCLVEKVLPCWIDENGNVEIDGPLEHECGGLWVFLEEVIE